MLEIVGAFLRRVHAITFRFPGYLMDQDGPSAPLDESVCQHPIWTAHQAQRTALAELAADRPRLSADLVRRLEPVYSTLADQ